MERVELRRLGVHGKKGPEDRSQEQKAERLAEPRTAGCERGRVRSAGAGRAAPGSPLQLQSAARRAPLPESRRES